MRTLISLLIAALLSFFALQARANLANDLDDGQHILLMRHADAPGYGDPVGYQIDQCSTQRNLGDKGKQQAILIGQWLSTQGIQSANIFSSPWCRCLDTARLLNKGPVNSTPVLGSFFDDTRTAKKQTQDLEKLIQVQLKENPRTPLILVTHQVNIESYTGKNVSTGDIILVKVDKHGKFISQQIYPSPAF